MSWRRAAAAAILLRVLVACGGRDAGPPPPDPQERAEMPGNTVTLSINAPMNVGESSVTAGNVAERDGQLTAQLWVIDPDPTFKKNFRVRPGQEFRLSGLTVRVVAVERSGVTLEVTPRTAGEP